MKDQVNTTTVNTGYFSSYKAPSRVMAARVPVPVAEAIEERRRQDGLSKSDVIIAALEAYFSDK